jgi:hypothetical protein
VRLLVQADFVEQRGTPRWWWGLIAAALCVAAVLWWDAAQSSRHADELRAQAAARSKAELDSLRTPRGVATLPKPYDASAREFLRQHETPWPQLLGAIESVDVPGVRFISVEYVAAEPHARVEIKVPQQATVVEIVNGLNAGLPEMGLAWRWSVVRVEQMRGEGGARALLGARWGQ